MPDNSYFDRRMANGDNFSEIFDDTDRLSKCYTEDKNRPVTVRVGRKYNYVANNYILFDSWFVLAEDFYEYGEYSYAYRRFNDQGIREGGVLIRRDGSYVTREEFLDIVLGNHNRPGKYAIVKQYDGLLNIVDVEKRIKIEDTGIKADSIIFADINDIESGCFIVVKGNVKNLHVPMSMIKDKNLKSNVYIVGTGILSPDLWFDSVDPFPRVRNRYGTYKSRFAIVELNEKYNYIDRSGHFLSDIWYDIALQEYSFEDGWIGIAGILKSESVKGLRDYRSFDEMCNNELNPNKYTIFIIDLLGLRKIRRLN